MPFSPFLNWKRTSRVGKTFLQEQIFKPQGYDETILAGFHEGLPASQSPHPGDPTVFAHQGDKIFLIRSQGVETAIGSKGIRFFS